jgi:peptidoglycan hydrolase-like protein with peptidoglycan-binding domain
MRDVLDGGHRRRRPVSIFALGTTTILSLAVVFNAFLGQNGVSPMNVMADGGSLKVPEGATTRMQVEVPPSGGVTIQLKYNPLVEDVQRQLQAAGYYKGTLDGVLGRKTRAAISAYQSAAGLEATGEPTQDLVEHIRFTREVAEAALFTGTVDAGSGAEERAAIRRVQTGLAELAYSPGEINGELTAKTRKAIRAFQRDRQLPETGDISDELLAELAKMSGLSEIVTD